jgi:hypothetical protein
MSDTRYVEPTATKIKRVWLVPWHVMGMRPIVAATFQEAEALAERLTPEQLVVSGDYEFETLPPELSGAVQ